jgi:hypothetical protein
VTGSRTAPATTVASPETFVVQQANQPVQFATPTGKIMCMVQDEALCKSEEHQWRAPTRPKGCDALAYGATLVSTASGGRSQFLCQGDNTFFGALPVLAYGHAWRYRSTQCVSRREGVTCTNLATSHGFFVSQASYRLF